MKKIIYFTTGKKGLHSFTYKELTLLENGNVKFDLFCTQLNKGSFNPKNNWKVYILKKRHILFGTVMFFCKLSKLFPLLAIALKNKRMKYFLLSLGFYYITPKDTYKSIHCQMADHKLDIAFYLSRMLEINITTTIHAHELYSRLYHNNPRYYKFLLTNCEKVFTISSYNKDKLIGDLELDESKIHIMYLYPAIDGYTKNQSRSCFGT